MFRLRKLSDSENKTKEKGRSFPWRALFSVLMILFLTLTTLVLFTIVWVKQTWAELTLEEIFYQLTMPLEGTGGGMIGDFVINAVVPTVILLVFWFCLLWLFRRFRRKTYLITTGCISLLSLIVLGISATYFWFDIGCDEYFSASSGGSDFIGEKYVNPSSVKLTFPEQKRNLIYIYLESMETTYADDANGGGFGEDNLIPELTALAQENEDFSGSDDSLNGGISLPGTTWTIGAMFAQTSGLPLKISIDGNEMSGEDSFFPGITTLGDILQEQGYHNELLIGSQATFGGRKLYFSTHGNYSFFDYDYAVDAGLIPSDYYRWWGYEDEKLFQYAKDELTSLASSDQPFNLTMLTVDTHFEDGYVCDLCEDTYGENQYANVMACSSKQVAAFIEWIQQQDFYENTTIIISGDHPTMDADFCEDVDKSFYERTVYTTYINAPVTPTDSEKRRVYSTFDAFPTTLAALGVEIDGNRLGLGTNLFSSTETLTESYSVDTMVSNLSKKSAFMDNLSGLENENTDITKYAPSGNFQANLDEDDNLLLTASDITDDKDATAAAYVLITAEETKKNTDDEEALSEKFKLNRNEDGSYSAYVSAEDLKDFGKKYLVRCYLVSDQKYEYEIGSYELP